jgi:hypothetical protein
MARDCWSWRKWRGMAIFGYGGGGTWVVASRWQERARGMERACSHRDRHVLTKDSRGRDWRRRGEHGEHVAIRVMEVSGRRHSRLKKKSRGKRGGPTSQSEKTETNPHTTSSTRRAPWVIGRTMDASGQSPVSSHSDRTRPLLRDRTLTDSGQMPKHNRKLPKRLDTSACIRSDADRVWSYLHLKSSFMRPEALVIRGTRRSGRATSRPVQRPVQRSVSSLQLFLLRSSTRFLPTKFQLQKKTNKH